MQSVCEIISLVFSTTIKIPVVDLFVAAFWYTQVKAAWCLRSENGSNNYTEPEERQLGATVMLAGINGVITGSSIIIVGIGAFVALTVNGTLADTVRWSLKYAAIWTVLGLCVAIYCLNTLPTRTFSENFVASRPVAILSAMSLYFVLAGAVRFAIGVALALSP